MLNATHSIYAWQDLKIRALIRELEEVESTGDLGRELKTQCPECSGTGTIVDIGERSGEEFDASCPDCNGGGRIVAPLATLDLSQIRSSFTEKDFFQELESDLKALARWTGTPPEDVLTRAGFLCWSNIENRALQCLMKTPSAYY